METKSENIPASLRALLIAWEQAQKEHLEAAFKNVDMKSTITPALQGLVKESFDAGWAAAVKYFGVGASEPVKK